MQAQAQLIRNKCSEVFAKAQELWPHLDFSKVAIRFDLRGRAAGQAYRKFGQYGMRFNADMLTREAFDHVINDTVPHEIGHIVCYMDSTLGRNHDRGWASVVRKLGGSADRTHKEEVVMGKGTTYEYVTTVGHKVRVGDRIHNNILRGASYTYRGGKGQINKSCTYSIVGKNGRTLATPIVRNVAPAAPATPAPVTTVVVPAVKPDYTEFKGLPTPMQNRQLTVPAELTAGRSKAEISRALMVAGSQRGDTYETIIAAMMATNGYTRQLARATYKANAPKVGLPVQ